MNKVTEGQLRDILTIKICYKHMCSDCPLLYRHWFKGRGCKLGMYFGNLEKTVKLYLENFDNIIVKE